MLRWIINRDIEDLRLVGVYYMQDQVSRYFGQGIELNLLLSMVITPQYPSTLLVRNPKRMLAFAAELSACPFIFTSRKKT